MAQRTFDGTLKFKTELTEAQAARKGKFSITGETVNCTDVKTSTVIDDHERVNDKAVTIPRSKNETVDAPSEAPTEEPADDTTGE